MPFMPVCVLMLGTSTDVSFFTNFGFTAFCWLVATVLACTPLAYEQRVCRECGKSLRDHRRVSVLSAGAYGKFITATCDDGRSWTTLIEQYPHQNMETQRETRTF